MYLEILYENRDYDTICIYFKRLNFNILYYLKII